MQGGHLLILLAAVTFENLIISVGGQLCTILKIFAKHFFILFPLMNNFLSLICAESKDNEQVSRTKIQDRSFATARL